MPTKSREGLIAVHRNVFLIESRGIEVSPSLRSGYTEVKLIGFSLAV
jgi:hypothetical protein